MKRFLFLIITLFLFFFTTRFAYAKEQKTVYLPENEIVNNLYFKTGGTITIDGTVNGEAYLIGENIIVNGNINGDLIATGVTVTFNGNVSDNVRLAGGTVSISGHIGKNALIFGGQTEVEKNAVIQGNLVEFSRNTNILGKIDGEARITAANIFFNGKTGQNAKLISNNISFGNNFLVGGNLEYQAVNQIASLKPQVKGNVVFVKRNGHLPTTNLKQLGLKLVSLISWINYLCSLIIGFLLVFVFPKQFSNINKFLAEKPLASFIFGLVFYCLIPFGLIILGLTIIGIPLAFLFIFLLVLLIFVSRVVVGLLIGSRILSDGESKFLPLLLGLTILQIVSLIPYLGLISKVLIVILGSGAVLLSKLGKYAK